MTHLSDKQIERLKGQIMARRRELAGEIRAALVRSDDQHHRDLAGMVADIGDASVADMIVDLGTAIADRHVQELRELEAARSRIADGTFGLCADCGGEIPFARLEALVTALRCVRCQEQREKTHAHGETPKL